jgi:transaldolase
MAGRLEDWLRVVAERDGILVAPGVIGGQRGGRQAGLRHLRERGYHTLPSSRAPFAITCPGRSSSAGTSCSDPAGVAATSAASDLDVRPRMDKPVDPAVIAELEAEFRRA